LGAAGLALSEFGLTRGYAVNYSKKLKIEDAKEVSSICPFCAVNCHFIAHVKNDTVVSTEGDYSYPVSEGSLCAKGASMLSMINSEHRLLKPLYRAPYSDQWEEKDWDWVADRVARKIKETRDRDFRETNESGERINRVDSMFHAGSAQMSNEEASVVVQALRALGLVNIDHQARV
jgi:formate dehydrogenase major subunit